MNSNDARNLSEVVENAAFDEEERRESLAVLGCMVFAMLLTVVAMALLVGLLEFVRRKYMGGGITSVPEIVETSSILAFATWPLAFGGINDLRERRRDIKHKDSYYSKSGDIENWCVDCGRFHRDRFSARCPDCAKKYDEKMKKFIRPKIREKFRRGYYHLDPILGTRGRI